jgi:hypothetical protein
MWAIVIFGMIGIQAILGIVYPSALIYVSLAVGALPLSFGEDGPMISALGRMDLSAIRLLGLWFGACLVVLFHLGKTSRYRKVLGFHLLFLAYCAAALAWGPSIGYGMRMFAKLSSVLLFLMLILLTISRRAQLRIMERLIFCSGLLLFFGALAAQIVGISASKIGLTFPGIGPSLFSALLVVVAILAVASAKYAHRVRNSFFVAILSAGTIAAFTRITIAALFVGCSTILFMGFKGVLRFLVPACSLVAFPALFLFNDTFKKRMFYGENEVTLAALIQDPAVVVGHLHTSGRSNAWGSILERFFYPSPLMGSGLGATQDYYYSKSSGIGVIHSEYVRLLSEVGLAGVALFAVAMLAYLACLIRTYRRARSTDTARYALAAIGALVAYLIYIATDNGFDYVTGFGIYVFALIGMSEKSKELDNSAVSAVARIT